MSELTGLSFLSESGDEVGRMSVTSTQFQQDVGPYQDAALQGLVVITKHGRPHTVLGSAAPFEPVMKGRQARRMEDRRDKVAGAGIRGHGLRAAGRAGDGRTLTPLQRPEANRRRVAPSRARPAHRRARDDGSGVSVVAS
jgi:prevent-host-death family protein